jgi:hypothetical protein
MNEKRKMHSKEVKQKAVELSNVRGNIQEIVWKSQRSLPKSLSVMVT